ncbi:hypothetical protein ACFFX1_10675 [Dactylosporangium sucinum]|uniref:Uncharacterized protein n=1 Tax=Dactylosporangium sucinum TaxID=1424081 RepID=A0A917TI49_9ACTN|nr:hypothetical protein [Dactylosporangium sucinum]GGM23178.1 hypothetical protein GCM10007977_025490 [Dactylosporangium sucinum]
MTAADVAALAIRIGSARYRYRDELQLHDGIAAVLAAGGVTARREVPLGDRCRIDFLVAGGIGIEVKVDGEAFAVWRQLQRYARRPDIRALLLVTTRARHAAGAPAVLGDVPVTVLVLRGGL